MLVPVVQYAACRFLKAEFFRLRFSSCNWHRHPKRVALAMSSRLDSAAAGAERLDRAPGGIGCGDGYDGGAAGL